MPDLISRNCLRLFVFDNLTMRLFLITMSFFLPLESISQELEVIGSDKTIIRTEILNDKAKNTLLMKFNVVQDDGLRKKWTARTYRLSDNRFILEFYDKQAIVVSNLTDLRKLEEVTFVKNTIWNLKKKHFI